MVIILILILSENIHNTSNLTKNKTFLFMKCLIIHNYQGQGIRAYYAENMSTHPSIDLIKCYAFDGDDLCGLFTVK